MYVNNGNFKQTELARLSIAFQAIKKAQCKIGFGEAHSRVAQIEIYISTDSMITVSEQRRSAEN